MMLKSSNKTDVNTTELIISIDAETFEAAVEAEYQREKKNIQIKGFRKGKVSRKLAEKTFGEGAFYEGAINSLLGPEIEAAIAQENLNLVDRPNVEVLSIDKETGVEIKAVCVTKPEIELSDYKGIKAAKKVNEITDADVDKQIDIIRKKNARIVSVEDRPAQMGDEVTIDFEGFFGDEAFEGGKGENHPLVLGSGQFIPGFEDQVAGHSVGDEFDVIVTFPEDYQMTDYAGKEAVFKTKINAITLEELPEIDDELVKDATEFDTVDEYKANIRTQLEEAAAKQAEAAFENAVLEALINKVDAPIPNCMFEQRIDEIVASFDRQLQQQGMSLKLYCQYTGMDEQAIRDTYRERAEGEVKLRLALEKVAELENFEVTEDEINNGLGEIAAANNMDVATVRRFINVAEYAADLRVQKAIEFIRENAVVDNAEEAAE
ncbi:MAG: trigger factor [Ruminococcus sp.]|nr:trigger factor [Ruminococcus sp.]